MLCQVPSASRPSSTGTVAYGGTIAGITCERPCPGEPWRCRQRSSAGSRSPRAASRSSSAGARLDDREPGGGVGHEDVQQPVAPVGHEVGGVAGQVEDDLVAAGAIGPGLAVHVVRPLARIPRIGATLAPDGRAVSTAVPARTTLPARPVVPDSCGTWRGSGGEAWVSSFKADRVYHLPLD